MPLTVWLKQESNNYGLSYLWHPQSSTSIMTKLDDFYCGKTFTCKCPKCEFIFKKWPKTDDLLINSFKMKTWALLRSETFLTDSKSIITGTLYRICVRWSAENLPVCCCVKNSSDMHSDLQTYRFRVPFSLLSRSLETELWEWKMKHFKRKKKKRK